MHEIDVYVNNLVRVSLCPDLSVCRHPDGHRKIIVADIGKTLIGRNDGPGIRRYQSDVGQKPSNSRGNRQLGLSVNRGTRYACFE